MANKKSKYKLIDLFCGCGGMTLGFKWNHLFKNPPSNPTCISNGSMPEADVEIEHKRGRTQHLHIYKAAES